MNAIARKDVAIVTEQAGTTRDVVEFRADLRGLPVIFLIRRGSGKPRIWWKASALVGRGTELLMQI